ncbi:hypothetical protein G6011_11709 [Alternaria panax]|uniref:Uncharacterized protein n=1 Tax=Alternaria panax TaxID=48097 RepID=A0AAD4IE98_9PLEO|nr:hypothetical protein G6011_11709 [Alternaria panax]
MKLTTFLPAVLAVIMIGIPAVQAGQDPNYKAPPKTPRCYFSPPDAEGLKHWECIGY